MEKNKGLEKYVKARPTIRSVDYPYGYWTSTAYSTNSKAWVLTSYGYLGGETVTQSTAYGFRPVITLSKTYME